LSTSRSLCHLEALYFGDVEKLVNVADMIEGRTICALGEAAAWPVQSFVKHFRPEFDYFVKNKRSMV
jgi:NADH-quinone oxidoreductase subunit F